MKASNKEAAPPPFEVGILCDFNAQNFASFLAREGRGQTIHVSCGPYGQVMPVLLNTNHEFWQRPLDLLIVWSWPQTTLPEFRKAMDFVAACRADLKEQVTSFASACLRVPASVGHCLVVNWALPDPDAAGGPLAMHPIYGLRRLLLELNLELAEQLGTSTRCLAMSPECWLQAGGTHPFHEKLWYLSKTPYSNEVFERAAREVVMTVAGMRGAQKRLLLVDLDHTLWGGILGEEGYEGLRLGGHDPIGEAYQDFQRELKRLKNRGVLLGIVSKNDEAQALKVIRDRPEMVLRPDDFVKWKINWQDKAQNVQELVAELNLRLESVVFIDDSAFERARVREALPEVTVPEWPDDPLKFLSALRRLGLFETANLTGEDQKRSQMYVTEQARLTLKTQANSLEAWLSMLEMEMRIEPLQGTNLERAAQLLNKTNQMNLSTRRMVAEAYREWEQGSDREVLVFRLQDRFGDYGLCGLASIQKEGPVARLRDFLLSCRVMGRGAETAMLAKMASLAFSGGCSELSIEFVPSPHNSPCLEWLRSQPWASASGTVFSLTPATAPRIPEHVRVSENGA